MLGYGRLIRESRESEGLTQGELAERLSIDRSVLSRIESEQVRVSPELFISLTTVLRTLRPAELVEAMGYPIGLSRQQRRVPPDLLDVIEAMEPALLEEVVRIARGLLLEARSRYHADRPEPPRHTP